MNTYHGHDMKKGDKLIHKGTVSTFTGTILKNGYMVFSEEDSSESYMHALYPLFLVDNNIQNEYSTFSTRY